MTTKRDDRMTVYLEGVQDEHGAFHPVKVDAQPGSYFIWQGTERYYRTGQAPDGVWIYRREK